MKERELESWICEHPSALCEGMQIVGRQVQMQHGIADLLAWNGYVLIIELKARPLTDKDIAQVLRYTYDVTDALRNLYARNRLEYGRGLKGTIAHQIHIGKVFDPNDSIGVIMPILVGTEANESVLASCAAAQISVYTWELALDTEVTFTRRTHREIDQQDADGQLWAETLHKNLIGESTEQGEKIFDRVLQRLFVGER